MSMSALEMHRLGPISAIPPGEGRTFRVGGRDVAVFRTRTGDLFATQAACPHRGAPLADGIVGGTHVVCPFHAYTFDLTTGEPVMNSCPALKTYLTTVDGEGEIRISMEEEDQPQPCLR